MCRVDLNHTTQPCRHRWYHLLSPCTSTSTLANCPSRLAIEGWEIKCDFCPFCAGWDVSSDDFMILGRGSRSGSSSSSNNHLFSSSSSSSAKGPRHGSFSSNASVSSGEFGDDAKFRSVPMGLSLSRQPSLTVSVSGARQASRSGSLAGSDAVIAPYDAGPVFGASEKNYQMNARIHGYIDELPELAAKSSSRRSKSKFRKSKAPEKEQVEDDETADPSWKRRSKSVIDLVRRR